MAATYRIKAGSIHEKFLASTSMVQVFGGGFANGKTAAMCIKCLKVAKDYPGANILMARSTYPKLNDTLRKEFLKWCPKEWIKSFPLSKGSDNICTLVNGTTIVFRYIAQQGTNSAGEGTSNLLSQTFDAAFVDQIEDPEIAHQDFLHLLGRMRGTALYDGDDPNMPRVGPGWIVLSCNPTRNWVYKKLIKPIHQFQKDGTRSDDLIYDDVTGKLDIELFEGSTYANADNIPADFLRMLENQYTGSMRKRFLMGQWAAFEGLVYPQWNSDCHIVSHTEMQSWFMQHVMTFNAQINFVQGYDFGIANPSCYGIGFVDLDGNVCILDGFHRKEYPLSDQIADIAEMQERYYLHTLAAPNTDTIFADPAIFKRTGTAKKGVVGFTTADEMFKHNIKVRAADNDILNGITRVDSYIRYDDNHTNPFTTERGAPRFYVTDKCDWIDDEAAAYRWRTNTEGEQDDMPVDKDDHSMDMIKYMLSRHPNASIAKRPAPKTTREMLKHLWYETADDGTASTKKARYA